MRTDNTSQPDCVGENTQQMYLLQNCTAGCVGNSPVFWHKSGSGYTMWIDEAKHWTAHEAAMQMQSTRGTHSWRTWPVELVEQLAKRTVDIQDYHRYIKEQEKLAAAPEPPCIAILQSLLKEYPDLPNMTLGRKKNREIFKDAVIELCHALPGVTVTECKEREDGDGYDLRIAHTSRFACMLDISKKLGLPMCIHWHTVYVKDQPVTKRLADSFSRGSVNPHHRHKATDISHTLVGLIDTLSTRFRSLEDGSAFLPEEPENAPETKPAATSQGRKRDTARNVTRP